MAELLRRVSYIPNLLDTGGIEDVRVLPVKPTDGPNPAVSEGVLYLPAQPVKKMFADEWRDEMPPYHDASRWGKPVRAVVFRRSESDPEEKPTWKQVKQLYFRVNDGEDQHVTAFYRDYGPLGYSESRADIEGSPPTGEDVPLWEPLGWVYYVLDVFTMLTNLVDWCLNAKIGPLRDRFGPPRETESPVLFLAGHSGLEVPWHLNWSTWIKDTKKKEPIYRTPKGDDELLRAGWETVLDWYAEWFEAKGRLAAIRHIKQRRIELTIHASTLLELAIAEFYLEQIAGETRTCPDCDRIIRVTKERCDKCGNKARQQRHRDDLEGTAEGRLPTYFLRVGRRHWPECEKEQVRLQLQNLAEKATNVEAFERAADQIVPKAQGGRKKRRRD